MTIMFSRQDLIGAIGTMMEDIEAGTMARSSIEEIANDYGPVRHA
jgi:hypothetical protein